jgi:hypothetical protein
VIQVACHVNVFLHVRGRNLEEQRCGVRKEMGNNKRNGERERERERDSNQTKTDNQRKK